MDAVGASLGSGKVSSAGILLEETVLAIDSFLALDSNRHLILFFLNPFFFFFLGTGEITILGTAKRNQPTKDKGQETKNRAKLS